MEEQTPAQKPDVPPRNETGATVAELRPKAEMMTRNLTLTLHDLYSVDEAAHAAVIANDLVPLLLDNVFSFSQMQPADQEKVLEQLQDFLDKAQHGAQGKR